MFFTYPPVGDHSQKSQSPFAGILVRLAAQNHPLTMLGVKSGRSHPRKLHLRPPVHMYLKSKAHNQFIPDECNYTICQKI